MTACGSRTGAAAEEVREFVEKRVRRVLDVHAKHERIRVKPKLVQTILRHSRLATTMDLYVHAYDEDLREAVGTLDRALGL